MQRPSSSPSPARTTPLINGGILFASLGLALVGCRGTGDAGDPAEGRPLVHDTAAPDDVANTSRGRESAAIAKIQSGDYEGARTILSELLSDRYLGEAEELLRADAPADALIAADQVLRLAPGDARGKLLKARGSLRLAEKGMAEGGSFALIQGALQDAFDYYRRSEGTEALFGASRAAWFQSNFEEALRYAQLGMSALEGGPEPTELPVVPERVLSEAAFSAYTDARAKEAGAEDVRRLFVQSEDALERLLGRSSADPWVWGKLSDLYEWEEMYADSLGILERGLAGLPDDGSLLDRLTRVARRANGDDGVLAALEAHNLRHPDLAVGQWYAARERFEQGTNQVMELFGTDEETGEPVARPTDAEALPALFRVAESEFVRCRELAPEFTDACKGYEVMCRNATGWARYQQGDLEGAATAFQSMNDLFERGMEWAIEGRLLSGELGMHFIGTKYNERGNWLAAAESYELLRAYQPTDSTWANNAGFFYRDAGIELELEGRRLCAAARGDTTDDANLEALRASAGIDASLAGTPEESAAFARAANDRMARAREIMAKSRAAYYDASKLAPEDVRVVNDTALVSVYYLHTDLEMAEELLLRCVEMGREQLKDETLDETARWELENAWGDAHENLGVLYANHKKEEAAALQWFEKAVEIGPEPRPILNNFWVPFLKGELDSSSGGEAIALRTWAHDCDHTSNR